jgi:hypothetical protein
MGSGCRRQIVGAGLTRLVIMAVSFAVSACASTDDAPAPARDWVAVTTAPGHTRVFLFADDDRLALAPMTANTHRIDINSNFVGTISNDQFVELELPAGQYAFEAYSYGWFGKLENHQTWNFNFGGSGQPAFLALTDHPDSMSLTPVDADYGKHAVDARSKAAMDVNSATLLSEPYRAPAGM